MATMKNQRQLTRMHPPKKSSASLTHICNRSLKKHAYTRSNNLLLIALPSSQWPAKIDSGYTVSHTHTSTYYHFTYCKLISKGVGKQRSETNPAFIHPKAYKNNTKHTYAKKWVWVSMAWRKDIEPNLAVDWEWPRNHRWIRTMTEPSEVRRDTTCRARIFEI